MPKPEAASTDDRKIVSVSMKSSLFAKIEAHCKEIDIPISLYMRQAARNQLAKETD